MYSNNDYRLYHSWGKKPEQKAMERQYNAWYYEHNKDKWKKYNANRAKFKNWVGETTGYNQRKRLGAAERNANFAFSNFNRLGGYDQNPNVSQTEQTIGARARHDMDVATSLLGETYRAYAKTPLGRLENFVDSGKAIVSGIISGIKSIPDHVRKNSGIEVNKGSQDFRRRMIDDHNAKHPHNRINHY